MTEPRDWPIDRPASLRPWFLSATGYLGVLFEDHTEAQRAQRSLVEHGVPGQDIRLYTSEQILDTEARLKAERSSLAQVIATVTADHELRRRYLDTAAAGGAGLWLYAPTRQRANQLIQLLAGYDYRLLLYLGDDGSEAIVRDPD